MEWSGGSTGSSSGLKHVPMVIALPTTVASLLSAAIASSLSLTTRSTASMRVSRGSASVSFLMRTVNVFPSHGSEFGEGCLKLSVHAPGGFNSVLSSTVLQRVHHRSDHL